MMIVSGVISNQRADHPDNFVRLIQVQTAGTLLFHRKATASSLKMDAFQRELLE